MRLGRRRHAAADPRRREVEAVLAAAGLLRRPHLVGAAAVAGDGGLRLRDALSALGPVFRDFGRYLATRADLLPLADAQQLAPLGAGREPLPPAGVRARLAAELGEAPEAVLAALDDAPLTSDLLVQAHRARLRDGREVVLRLVRGRPEEECEPDLELLSLLADGLSALGLAPAAAAEAVSDYRADLGLRADPAAAARALELLAADARAFGLLAAPALLPSLCTPLLLTVEEPEGTPLEAVAGAPPAAARRLCVVWLRQALLGRAYPLAPDAGGTALLPDGRVSFGGAPFAEPAPAAQRDLWELLVAFAGREPDTAASYLLRQLRAESATASEERLRADLRQVVPFRDGAWSATGDDLVEHVFAAVRAARRAGYAPRPPLRDLCRGFFGIAGAARRWQPGGDAVREALQEVRVLASLTQVREALDPGQWGGQLERYAAIVAELPQRLDSLLTRAAAAPPPQPAAPAEPAVGGMRAAALMLALAAVALLAQRLAAAGWLAGLGEALAAALFLGLGALLLRAAARGA